ncbi:MAG: caspase family protein [Spirochaetia bacterium]|jgi:hypothetical protein
MRRSLSLVLAITAALLASCSLTLFNYSDAGSKRYALVYGVTEYIVPPTAAGANDPNLGFPASDAAAVAIMLKQENYIVSSRWVDAAGEEYVNGADTATNIATNTGASPNITNISNDITTLAGTVGPNDLVVFYFSGHGMQDSYNPPNEYFVPSGGVYYDSGTNYYYGNPAASVSQNQFASMLSVLNTKRKVVILDTCNSGGFIGNTLEADSIPTASSGSAGGVSPQTLAQALSNYVNFPSTTDGLSPYGGAMVLSAAGRDESCYEASSPYNHGVMTYYFLMAQQQGDLNRDGHVTVSEAFSLVKAGIDTGWNPGNPGLAFEPRISGGPIDFVLW